MSEKRCYGFIAQEKEKERFVGDADVTRRGFFRNARIWHKRMDQCREELLLAKGVEKQSRRVGCGECVVLNSVCIRAATESITGLLMC